MANYPTSSHKLPSGRQRRYVVTYIEDCADPWILTFGLDARSMSEATSRTIGFIDLNNLHYEKDYGYILTVKVSQQQTDYNIPYKINPEI
jgi:hypothetical protein